MRPQRAESGLATTWAVGITCLLVGVTLVCAGVGGVFVGQRQAQLAADLGALAGARALQHGGDACATAGVVVDDNHGRLTRCDVGSQEVTIAVEVRQSVLVAGDRTFRARSRAGPDQP